MSQSNDSGLNLDHLEALPSLPRAHKLIGPRLESLECLYSEMQMREYARAALANQPAPTVPAATKEQSLLSQMAFIAAYDLDELDGGYTQEGMRAACRLKCIIDHARRACEAHQPAQEQAEPIGEVVANDPVHGWHVRVFKPWNEIGAGTKLYAAQQEPVAAPQQAESRKKAAVVGWEQRINAVAPALRVKTKEQAMEAEIAAWRELARQQAAAPEQFCDANCVWTDHHKDCTISAPGTPEAPKDDRKGIELWRATLRACGNLPEGYEVRIELENGCGMAVWYDAEGERHVIDGEGYLSDDVNEAVDAAIQRAAQLDGGQEGSGE
jgi:hypothetical protein